MNSTMQRLLLAGAVGAGAALAIRTWVRSRRWFNYLGKVAVITGGSRGLGLVLARQLVAAGARVVLCARSPEDLQRAAAELQAAGGQVLAIPCDVRDADEVRQMVAEVISQWGTIDLLFSVAGVIEVGPLDAMTLDDFHNSLQPTCWGALHTTLAVLPEMRRKGWGRIVNVASIGGKRAVPHMLPYAASKFALVGLSTGLRAELAPEGILVTTVCPGLMRTGSPRNAIFKGQHRKEYAWFSIGDSLPLVSMSAESAAGKILLACQRGQGEVLIGSTMMRLQALAPALTAQLTEVMARLLPQMGGIGRRAARGFESSSAWSPSWLTYLGDQAAERNNELRTARHPK